MSYFYGLGLIAGRRGAIGVVVFRAENGGAIRFVRGG